VNDYVVTDEKTDDSMPVEGTDLKSIKNVVIEDFEIEVPFELYSLE